MIGPLVAASWPLVAVAARALAAVQPGLTLAQYRILALLDARGMVDSDAVALLTSVDPYAARHALARLCAAGMAEQGAAKRDGHAERWQLTPAGQRVVHDVAERWRRQVACLAQAMPPGERAGLVDALRALSDGRDSFA